MGLLIFALDGGKVTLSHDPTMHMFLVLRPQLAHLSPAICGNFFS